MLNNLTNFFNLITNRFTKTSADPEDVLMLGVPDKRYDGGYKPVMIKYKNLVAETVVAAGSGISVIESTGLNSEKIYTISSAGSTVNYSNVLFVDPVFGNNITAVPGRFDLPYQSIAAAALIAGTLGGTINQRILIYIRKGEYNTNINLRDWVDFYCEPGVIIQGGSIRDNGVAVTSNFLGYAKFVNKVSTTLSITANSTVTFEFDTINQTSGAVASLIIGGSFANITIKGNSIDTTTAGTGFGMTIRGTVNLTMDIKSFFRASHSVFDIRANYSGVSVINCPRIILGATNLFGGNFKQVVYITSSTIDGKITINGDLINEMPAFIGGIAGMITNWSFTSGTVELNGNIYAGETYGLYGSGNQVPGKSIINGSIFSNIQPVFCSSVGSYYIRNGVINKQSTVVGPTIGMNQNAKLFLSNASIYNAQPDGDLILVIDSTNDLNLYNVVGQSEGLLGFAITSSNTISAKVHGSRFNKPLGGTVADILTPSGFINDPLVIVPKF